jgi:hypothetical protein
LLLLRLRRRSTPAAPTGRFLLLPRCRQRHAQEHH